MGKLNYASENIEDFVFQEGDVARDFNSSSGTRFSVADFAHMERLPPLLTEEETAEILRISNRTVSRMCADGDLPSIRVGRKWRIRTFDLLDMLGFTNISYTEGGYPSHDPC